MLILDKQRAIDRIVALTEARLADAATEQRHGPRPGQGPLEPEVVRALLLDQHRAHGHSAPHVGRGREQHGPGARPRLQGQALESGGLASGADRGDDLPPLDAEGPDQIRLSRSRRGSRPAPRT